MRIIIAGGGTGGHVIPALAIAQQLKKQFGAEVLFIGTARGIETRLVPAAGFPLELIQVGALKNVSLMTRAKTLFDLPRAIAASSRMLSEFDPEVVIGVGGYASGPAMVAAIRRRLPTLAFEPNVVPGFANRMIARWVSAAAVHFEETCQYFPHCQVTGVPVRAAVLFDCCENRRSADVAGFWRQSGGAGDQSGDDGIVAWIDAQKFPASTSFTRPGSATTIRCWRLISSRESRARCTNLLTTCRGHLGARICWSAVREPARLARSRRRVSRRFLCRFRRPPMIIRM